MEGGGSGKMKVREVKVERVNIVLMHLLVPRRYRNSHCLCQQSRDGQSRRGSGVGGPYGSQYDTGSPHEA